MRKQATFVHRLPTNQMPGYTDSARGLDYRVNDFLEGAANPASDVRRTISTHYADEHGRGWVMITLIVEYDPKN